MRFLRNKLVLAIIVLSIIFLALISFSIKGNSNSIVRNGIGVTFNSFQGGLYKVNNSIKNSLSFIINFSRVKSENEELKKENSSLKNKLVEYNSLKNDNSQLRKELNFKSQKSEYDNIGCDVIGRSSDGILNEFAINRGSKDGIRKQMVAVTADGLVGQVVHVENNWSIVQSLANQNLAVGGTIEGTSTDTNDVTNSGMVKGYSDSNNQFLAKLYYLPQDSTIKKGDVIVTSGINNSYPRGIRIGTVISVEDDKGKVMKNALIKPYVNFDKLQELLIVVPQDKTDIKY
ncbi:rod shape-determining protein MreC [Clostridium autoethanogenum]|jgi:rod shape-determining protein MreC|uniref:Cell shape-determining protein MreC n=1 Tax=Clostridium autoethanogenum DSM 10061 TaxID=1341692 RepID=A0ABN4BHP0_9CLOT|nr:rod shape-determining protein MreC [Clostridium autoethanogenum]AGY77022.1 rod shape-determining protein MreC [Clostridium autoethanogenum DSM 10061]ALU37164.1 Rod shape-determining protein MreC [Clostridium autoethanogenum DSM 10061]OVY50263.1 Cell shape-determining protein MreC precursor [Clostridium autoethanogenum]